MIIKWTVRPHINHGIVFKIHEIPLDSPEFSHLTNTLIQSIIHFYPVLIVSTVRTFKCIH